MLRATEKVWNEGTQIISDRACGLADAETATLLIDHPEAEDGVARSAVRCSEDRVRGERLADVAAAAVRAGRLEGRGVGADERDVGALAGEEGLADVAGHSTGHVEVGFEQQLMIRVELPQDGQDALVREQQLPDGLDPANRLIAVERMRAELLGEHRLPGVELEDGEHLVFVGIEEALQLVVPADLGHEHLQGVEAGLLGGVAQVGEGELVLGIVEPGEVDGLREIGIDVLPLGDELLVDGVELVGRVVIGLPGNCFLSSSHFHWMTEASSSVVGVSALYSSSLGAWPLAAPAQERSKRP